MSDQQQARTLPEAIDARSVEGLMAAISDNPKVGRVEVRVRHRWAGGWAVDGQALEANQGGAVTERVQHRFRTDWPEPFGADSGPTPGAESVLAAVGACVATTWAAKAALAGIAIEELEVMTEGRVDLRGLLELDPAVAPRFKGIRVTVGVRSDADPQTLQRLGETVGRTSPAFDALANPVAIELAVEPRATRT